MKTITLTELNQIYSIDSVEIHSHDSSIYTVRMHIDKQYYRLLEQNNKPYQRRSVEQVKKDLIDANSNRHIGSLALIHQSAYDEMVGQPPREEANRLTVPLAIS